MKTDEGQTNRILDPSGDARDLDLSIQDIDRLTNYKWRYSLEAHGFSTDQATRLLFMKWLYRQGSVGS